MKQSQQYKQLQVTSANAGVLASLINQITNKQTTAALLACLLSAVWLTHAKASSTTDASKTQATKPGTTAQHTTTQSTTHKTQNKTNPQTKQHPKKTTHTQTSSHKPKNKTTSPAPQKSTAKSATAEKPFSQRKDVKQFIDMMVKKYHFDRQELVTLFNRIHIQPAVIHSIKHPAEKANWHRYERIFMTPKRINEGVQFWQQHEKTLTKAEKEYGVPASIIVAIIGVETYYGERQGTYPVFDALATLAFGYEARAPFFKSELKEYLLLSRENQLDPGALLGSYAGAMGAPQFMPSSYRHYAVDYSGSGSKNLQDDYEDVIGSVANYLKQKGWHANMPIATRATVTNPKPQSLQTTSLKPTASLKALAKQGVKPIKPYPSTYDAKFIILEGGKKPQYWLGFHNFYVITRYNASVNYAMAVYQLSRELNKARKKQHHISLNKQPNQQLRNQIQRSH